MCRTYAMGKVFLKENYAESWKTVESVWRFPLRVFMFALDWSSPLPAVAAAFLDACCVKRGDEVDGGTAAPALTVP